MKQVFYNSVKRESFVFVKHQI
jgi:hypothetical protein